jgi:hypothetical protein
MKEVALLLKIIQEMEIMEPYVMEALAQLRVPLGQQAKSVVL